MGTCFLCRKHNGEETAPPGGYIYEDEHGIVCHALAKLGPLGRSCIESRRHFLDYAEMTKEESTALGDVMRKIYYALRLHTNAERIYQVTLRDGVPDFHFWLVPRRNEDTEKGIIFLIRDDSCNEEAAIEFVGRLRESMKK